MAYSARTILLLVFSKIILEGNKEFVVKPIILEKLSKQKFKWAKFREFAEHIKRAPEHLSLFLSAEMGISVNLGADFLCKYLYKRLCFH